MPQMSYGFHPKPSACQYMPPGPTASMISSQSSDSFQEELSDVGYIPAYNASRSSSPSSRSWAAVTEPQADTAEAAGKKGKSRRRHRGRKGSQGSEGKCDDQLSDGTNSTGVPESDGEQSEEAPEVQLQPQRQQPQSKKGKKKTQDAPPVPLLQPTKGNFKSYVKCATESQQSSRNVQALLVQADQEDPEATRELVHSLDKWTILRLSVDKHGWHVLFKAWKLLKQRRQYDAMCFIVMAINNDPLKVAQSQVGCRLIPGIFDDNIDLLENPCWNGEKERADLHTLVDAVGVTRDRLLAHAVDLTWNQWGRFVAISLVILSDKLLEKKRQVDGDAPDLICLLINNLILTQRDEPKDLNKASSYMFQKCVEKATKEEMEHKLWPLFKHQLKKLVSDLNHGAFVAKAMLIRKEEYSTKAILSEVARLNETERLGFFKKLEMVDRNKSSIDQERMRVLEKELRSLVQQNEAEHRDV